MRRLILLINVLATAAAILLMAQGHWMRAVLILFPGHMLVLWATLNPSCTWFGPVVRVISGNDVVLTFDDGPDPHDTPFVLDQLRDHDAKAIFFLIGNRAAAHPELVRRILAEGHAVGNHTQSHPATAFWRLGRAPFEKEIGDCQKTLESISGQPVTLFRPPVGHHNFFLHPVLKKHHLPLIGWSARGLDGISKSPQQVLSRMLPQIQPGGILLLHEGPRMADGTALIEQTLPAVLQHLRERGLKTTLPKFPPP